MKRGAWILCVLSGALPLALFWSCCSYGLCASDDYQYIIANGFVGEGLSIRGLLKSFTYVGQSIWMPLTWITYLVDSSVGWGTVGMHGVNVAIHAINATILFALLVRLSASQGKGWLTVLAAFVATAIWSLHPLRVESVVWIASRKDEISTFFLLLSLLVWVSSTTQRGAAAALALVAVGALGKPSVMVFPAFALPLDFLVLRRERPKWVYAVLLALSFAIAVEASLAQGVAAMEYSGLIPLWYKAVNAVAAITVYLGNFLWPDRLAVQCMIRYPNMPMFSFPGVVALVCAFGFCVLSLYPRWRRFESNGDWREWLSGGRVRNCALAACVMFFGSLVPFLGLVGFGFHAFADRFTLVPCVAMSFLFVVLAGELRSRRMKGLLAFAGAVCCVAFAFRTERQIGYWRNDGALFEHTLAVDGDWNVTAHRTAGIYFWEIEHDMAKTYAHLRKSLENSKTDYLRNSMMSDGNLLIEAMYETGHADEAEDFYYQMRKWNHRVTNGLEDTSEFKSAEAMYLSNRKGGEKAAKEILSDLQRSEPDSYITRNLAYYLARRFDGEDARKAALAACPVQGGDPYCRNRWALSESNP